MGNSYRNPREIIPVIRRRAEQRAANVVINPSQGFRCGDVVASRPQGDYLADHVDLRVAETIPPLCEEFCCLVVRLTDQNIEKPGINREEILVIFSQFTVPINLSPCGSGGKQRKLAYR